MRLTALASWTNRATDSWFSQSSRWMILIAARLSISG